MTTFINDSFDELHRRRACAVAALERLAEAAVQLRLERRSCQLQEMAAQVADDRFRLTFIGSFDAGKSTLVNALLGERLLPTGLTPVTAAVTVIRHGPARQAWIVRGGIHAEREPTPLEDLRTYLRIYDDAEQPEPIFRVEIEVPSELLANGIEIVDTPGLDDALANGAARTDKVVGHLPYSDAVVFVTQIGGAMNARERAFVEDTLRPLGLHDLFIVCTRADELLDMPGDERDETIGRIRKSLGDLVPPERLFLVDGLRALRARTGGEPAAPAETGLPLLDQCLRRFLSTDRGSVKLTRATTIGRDAGADMSTVVTARRQVLNQPDHERENAEEVLRVLPIMHRQRKSVLETLDGIASVLEPGSEEKARDFMLEMAEQCPAWLDDLPPFAKVDWREIHHMRGRIETATKAVSQHFGDHLRREMSRWQEDTFAPYLRRQTGDLQACAEEEMLELFELSAQALRSLDYLGPEDEQVTPELLAQYFSGLDMREAIRSDARPGVPDVTRALINQAILIVAISILTAGFRFAASFLNVVQLMVRMFTRSKFEGHVATLAAVKIAGEMREKAPTWGTDVGVDVAKALRDLREKLRDGMDNRIIDVEQRVASRIAVLEGNRAAEAERLSRADDLIRQARSLLEAVVRD